MGCLVWLALVIARFGVCIYPPQLQGYIHPDQFFQITEPLAGDILMLDHFRTWDWNSTTPGPIRNVLFPYITTGISFLALKSLATSGLVAINSYTLQVFPRLAMAASSLVVDFAVFKTAKALDLNAWNCLTILASSYATLVYNTRAFTNVYECCVFALFLMLVVVSRQDQLRPIQPPKQKEEKKKEIQDDKSDKKKKKKQMEKSSKKKTAPLKSKSPNDIFIGFWLGVFIVEGTFSRPSFPVYFLIPLVFWLTGKETSLNGKAIAEIVKNMLCILPGAVVMLISCLLMDSVYYGTLDIAILNNPQFILENLGVDLLKNITVTPWNFIKYNADYAKLAEQGIHPRVTHLLVNMPLLFLPLFICLLMEIHAVYKARSQNQLAGFTASTCRAFFLLTFLTPIMLLSFIPHQEPRFILPIIVPLVLMYANFVMLRDSAFPNAPWIIFNLLGCFLFGQLHQGGLISCIENLRGIATQPIITNPISYHYVFFHTYMPPRHLFYLQDKILPAHANLTDEKYKHILDKKEHIVTVHDLMGAGRLDMHQVVEEILSDRRTVTPEPYQKEILVISPSSLDPIFCRMNVKYNFKLRAKFGSHLSMEDPPEWFPSYTCVAETERSCKHFGFKQKLDHMFSIFVYQVEIVRLFPPEIDPIKIEQLKRKKQEGQKKQEDILKEKK